MFHVQQGKRICENDAWMQNNVWDLFDLFACVLSISRVSLASFESFWSSWWPESPFITRQGLLMNSLTCETQPVSFPKLWNVWLTIRDVWRIPCWISHPLKRDTIKWWPRISPHSYWNQLRINNVNLFCSWSFPVSPPSLLLFPSTVLLLLKSTVLGWWKKIVLQFNDCRGKVFLSSQLRSSAYSALAIEEKSSSTTIVSRAISFFFILFAFRLHNSILSFSRLFSFLVCGVFLRFFPFLSLSHKNKRT